VKCVLDASPLIFLAKLNRLDLIAPISGVTLHLSTLVQNEVLGSGVAEAESQAVKDFLIRCRVHPSAKARAYAAALSAADNATLALAIHLKADLLVADDCILRAMAEAQGIRPLGTLGVLLGAQQRKILSARETRRLLDALIALHGFRISINVYQAALARIQTISGKR
jgi:predicted nucleic acid-binding protein